MSPIRLAFYIIANAAFGPGLSGGDRIFIECARRWAREGHDVRVYVWEEGYEMCKRNKLENVEYVIWHAARYKRLGFAQLYAVRTVKGFIAALKIRIPKTDKVVVYSASEFLMDSIPAWVIKTRNRHVKWIAGFYLFAPNPFKESVYKGRRFLRGLFYFLVQKPIYWLVREYADMVFVTNELDRWKFIEGERLTPDRVVAVRGGVDTRTPSMIPEPEEKRFDAVFVGRFHPQKGVLELLDVWKIICDKVDAKLAMIGIGQLEDEVRDKIKRYGLENNITLLGFKDGIDKIRIFKESRVVVHPAIYDSGGMAPCEAMACGLPGISFDLPALKTYYPKGMIKTPCYDLETFAKNVLRLLKDRELHERLRKEAMELARKWDWDERAKEVLSAIEGLFNEIAQRKLSGR